MNTDTIIKKAVEVSNFLLTMSREQNGKGVAPMPFDDFIYAEALTKWEEDNKNPNSFFSTEDPGMLHFRLELTERFGLPVLDREEGMIHEKRMRERMRIYRDFVTGAGDGD